MLEKPVIKGTRIIAAFVLKMLSKGASFQDIIDGYPGLNKAAINAVLAYASYPTGRIAVRSGYHIRRLEYIRLRLL